MKRKSGILLHITSLPSKYGIGDLGPKAYEFARFLSRTEQTVWQILPLNPPSDGVNPYHASSAFAGNPWLISCELLKRNNLLPENGIKPVSKFPENEVNFEKVISFKENLLEKAFERFKKKDNKKYENFCSNNSWWLDDFALFSALADEYEEKDWTGWPAEVKNRDPEVLGSLKDKLHNRIKFEKFLQFTFFRQWNSLKGYCNNLNIRIFGDLPIYLNHGSADVWANPEIFKLDDEKKPTVVSGVPPDAFSDTGQLWGHPIYDWKELKKNEYNWWVRRVEHALELYDLLRMDHFRGYVSYWEVPADEKNAVNGKWEEGPAEDLFPLLLNRFPSSRFIAEDLGEITEDVVEIRKRFNIPGMRVLIFGFGDDFPNNPHLPHNFPKNSLACTGTHDTNTLRGWWENEASSQEKKRLFRYLGKETLCGEVSHELVRLAMRSVSKLVSIPMQDFLNLGQEARMNTPGSIEGNWKWRLKSKHLDENLEKEIREMTKTYGRAENGREKNL